MFGPREMLLSSQEPVVRQFLNARRQGPIGMAEEKDAAELEAEKDQGELPPLPPIPPQISPSNGQPRRTQRPSGQWLKENGVTPPPGSFTGEEGYGEAAAPTAPPATTERTQQRATRERDGGAVTLLSRPRSAPPAEAPAPAKKSEPAKKTAPAKNTGARKAAAKKTAAKKTTAKKAAPRRSSRSEGDT